MKKPPDLLFELFKIHAIYKVEVCYRPDIGGGGSNPDMSILRIWGKDRNIPYLKGPEIKIEGPRDLMLKYLEIGPGRFTVASMRSKYHQQVKDWIEFEEINRKELKEYERLKTKFEKEEEEEEFVSGLRKDYKNVKI